MTVVDRLKLNDATVVHIAIKAARRNPPNGLTLYKGTAQSRLKGFADNQGIRAAILSSRPNELAIDVCYYFAEQLEIAEYYARYFRRTCPGPVLIVLRTLPPQFFVRKPSHAYTFQILFGNSLSSTVGGQRMFRETKQWRCLPVLMADIAKSIIQPFLRMSSLNEVTERCFLKCSNGAKGTQWKFSTGAGEDLLEQYCSDTYRILNPHRRLWLHISMDSTHLCKTDALGLTAVMCSLTSSKEERQVTSQHDT